MSEGICAADGCGGPVRSRGYCHSHYRKLLRSGALPIVKNSTRPPCVVDGCDRPNYGHGMCRAHWKRWRKVGDVLATEPIRSPEASLRRFWETIDSSGGPDACWPWTGRMKASGYGEAQLDGTTMTAARAAYILTAGDRPPIVRHACDNPPCCNPAHLLPGTHRDNMRDAVERGRNSRGERHTGAKLTEADVRQIRVALAAGEPQGTIARRHGVSRGTISSIVQGRNWKHVA